MRPKRILVDSDGSAESIRQWLSGSTARRVVSCAGCSVLVVRRA